uniref:Uncharacterized protein n=1 Tax=Triticum urartu TaxID=4572 RepID=A0A8R7Q9I1_TRIUA
MLLGGIPPESHTRELIGDLLMVVHGDLQVTAVAPELGLEPAGAAGARVAEVGLDGVEELALLKALGAVLQDGDLKVGAEAGGELGGPGGEVEAEGDRDVVLHHGPEEDDAGHGRPQPRPSLHHRHHGWLALFLLM